MYNASNVGFSVLNLTKATNGVRLVISNSIDGMMLKTSDSNRSEELKYMLQSATGSKVSYGMKGPMTSKFTIKGTHCSNVSSALGGYILAPPVEGGGPPIKINISTFLNDTGTNCDMFLQILIYSQPSEEYTIGQLIF